MALPTTHQARVYAKPNFSQKSPLHPPLLRRIHSDMNTKQYRVPALLSLVAATLVGCGHAEHTAATLPALPAVKTSVNLIQPADLPLLEEATGTVRARRRATLEAKVSGKILELPLTLGQEVKAGDRMAVIAAEEIQARVDQAKALLEQARREEARFAGLLKSGSVTQQEYDNMKARLAVAEGGLREAETMLGYTAVTAPFDGRVTRKLAEVGDLASPGRPIAEMEDGATPRLEADVPESLMGTVKPGDSLGILAGTNRLNAVVAEVAPAADASSRTFLVKLDLPAGAPLRTGQFARVLVPAGRQTVLVVPSEAVARRGQLEYVYVVRDGKAALRLIRTGRAVEGGVTVLSGLDAGETIAVSAAATLADGQPVETP